MYWWLVRAALVGMAVAFIANDGWKWNPTIGGVVLMLALLAGDEVIKHDLRNEKSD